MPSLMHMSVSDVSLPINKNMGEIQPVWAQAAHSRAFEVQ